MMRIKRQGRNHGKYAEQRRRETPKEYAATLNGVPIGEVKDVEMTMSGVPKEFTKLIEAIGSSGAYSWATQCTTGKFPEWHAHVDPDDCLTMDEVEALVEERVNERLAVMDKGRGYYTPDQGIEVIKVSSHRNGIEGEPFHTVLFKTDRSSLFMMLGIVFDTPHHVAVFDVFRLVDGDIEFGSNSWRGDEFEASLREAVAEYETSR